MKAYLLQIVANAWGQSIRHELIKIFSKKKTSLKIVTSIESVLEECAPEKRRNVCVIALDGSYEERLHILRVCHKHGFRLIFKNGFYYDDARYKYSSVYCNSRESMKIIFDNLRAYGKENIALFGPNMSIYEDVEHYDDFMCMAGSSSDKIFMNEEKLADCASRFIEKAHLFDAVVCVNNIAAILLVKKFESEKPELLSKMHIVAFSDMVISSVLRYSITTVGPDDAENAKMIYEAFNILQKHSNNDISVSIITGMKVYSRFTTEYKPFNNSQKPCQNTEVKKQISRRTKISYSEDSYLASLLGLESILLRCQTVELQVLLGLYNEKTVAQICNNTYFSESSVKRHIRAITNLLGLKNKVEVSSFLKNHLDKDRLLELYHNSVSAKK